MDELEDVSQATAHVAIDVDKQTTVVHYSRLFNLGNYENEKIGITLDVIPGQAVQDVIKAAEAEVKKQHEEYRDFMDKIREAKERLWQVQDAVREAEVYKEQLLAEIKALEEVNPEATKAVQEVTEDPGDFEDDEDFDDDYDDEDDRLDDLDEE